MKRKVALIGNPNCGKSSIFNILTGLRQRVGNFPGITVDKKIGRFQHDNVTVELIDLPGLYSLFPTASDERLVVNILTNPKHDVYPDYIVYVADSVQLERHLLLATQLLDLGIPMLFVLNMADIAKEAGISINKEKLSQCLGIPVVSVSARDEKQVQALKPWIAGFQTSNATNPVRELNKEQYKLLDAASQFIKFPKQSSPNQGQLQLHHSKWFSGFSENEILEIDNIKTNIAYNHTTAEVEETMERFAIINKWVPSIVQKETNKSFSWIDKIDHWTTHKIIGPIVFFGIMFLVFQALFSWASYPSDWIEQLFGWLGSKVASVIGENWISSLLVDGVIAGISGVMVFVPQIFFLFMILTILEEIGYMSRVVFMFDKILRVFGLNGRSVVALTSGGACAIPAIMSTRTISNWKERLITIMVAPLISCSARIPVYVLLIGFVISSDSKWSIFNAQGLAFMGLYVLSIIASLCSAWVFKKILQSKDPSFLLIELPQYKTPLFKNIALTIKEKVFTFIWEAGKIIFLISIVLWALSYFGPPGKMEAVEQHVKTELIDANFSDEEIEQKVASLKLEQSYAGHLGKFIEPVIEPLGFDWKIGIALITSFAAREVFVGTMSTIYAVGSENEGKIRDPLRNQINPKTGQPVFTPAVALSLIIFYLFAMQCMSTLAITKRETKSWKWPTIQFVYMSTLAYLGSFIVFQLLS